MPPSVANATSGKKNKKNKSNVQQVQPQQQKDLSLETSQISDSEKQIENRIVVDSAKDELEDVPLIDASPPMPPPRPGRTATTVLPPTAPATRIPAAFSPSLPTGSGKQMREKTPVIAYNKGQIVKATSVPQTSLVNSMAEFVHENIQQSQSPTIQPEKIDWVQFFSIDRGCDKKCDVILMGLCRGFQVWIKYENGDFEEVMSERQGPIKSFVFLTPVDKMTGLKAERNPMIAFVDAFSHVPDRQFSTVSVVDLLSKKVSRLPSASDSFEETVTGLSASDRYLVVGLTSRIIVYDTIKFTKVGSFRIATPPEGSAAVCSINHGLLAYADDNLNSEKQSCGGLEPGPEEPATYTSQTINMFKALTSTVKNIGESVTGSGTAKGKDNPQGIVTVVNLDEEKETPTIAHFVAHFDPLAHISWSPDGRLLLATDANGCSYNIFLLMSHPASSSLTSVQHLYRLHRGNTAAKVYCTSFTIDCRWLAVATNHGTTHIFAINPYGGKPTMATHGDDFTNKESRFLRSAGLTESNENLPYSARSRTHSGQIQVNKDHPALKQRILAKCSGNPRIGPFNPPLLLTAVKKIRDPRISTDNLSAWATDLNPVVLSSKKSRTVELPRTALMFSNRHIATRGAFSLLIARADNGIFEYELKPRPDLSDNPEKAPELEVISSSMWALQRTKNNPDIPPPLQAGSPLVTFEKQREKPPKSREDWIPQLEIATYSVPSRRLWQGPQFSFFIYSEDTQEVMTPSDSRSSVASIKCIPIVIGDKSMDRDESVGEATRIECGSWVSQNSLTMTTAVDEGELSIKIADAMREVHLDRGLRQNSSTEDFSADSPRGDGGRSNSGDSELLLFDDL